MRIDLYCNDGSPLRITPPIIYTRGVGGAELSMMTWAEIMASRGHDVRVYNNPDEPGDYDGVAYLPQSDFQPSEAGRDVFITYRSPNRHTRAAKADLKVHWSTDQFTIGHYATDIVPYVDKIVCISPFHQDYYETHYRPSPGQIGYIDLGVKLEDYDQTEFKGKVKGRFIYCSQPERGLSVVKAIWPMIKAAIPEASLVITADHRLWGVHSPNNHQYRLDFLQLDGIAFLGAIPRKRLVAEQLKAQIHLYSATYMELFCIASAECQVAGAYSMTSDAGALRTTNQFGQVFPGSPIGRNDGYWRRGYTEAVIELMKDQDRLMTLASEGQKAARARFGWSRICDEWERLFETGEFPAAEKVEAT